MRDFDKGALTAILSIGLALFALFNVTAIPVYKDAESPAGSNPRGGIVLSQGSVSETVIVGGTVGWMVSYDVITTTGPVTITMTDARGYDRFTTTVASATTASVVLAESSRVPLTDHCRVKAQTNTAVTTDTVVTFGFIVDTVR